MVILNNLMSMFAYNSLKGTNSEFDKRIKSLSTGLRINSAADDAAGLAISEKLRAQIGGLDKALANTQDGISLLQTAEGGLDQINSALLKIRSLTVQASNDTLTSQDRSYIQKEISELREHINQISKETRFGKKNLLDGSLGGLWSSNDLDTHAHINGELTTIDEFGDKKSVEGNYIIDLIAAPPGETQIQKSNIFNLTVAEEVKATELSIEIVDHTGGSGIDISTGCDIKTGESSGDGWEFSGGVLTIYDTGKNVYRITGSSAVNKIKIAPGSDTIILLDNVDIDVSGTSMACAFDMTDAKVDLYLSGTNTLKSGQGRAGLEVPDGAELILSSVEGDFKTAGTLIVAGGDLIGGDEQGGAGIGGAGSYREHEGGRAGSITINGGTINAYGSVGLENSYRGGAGIGGGNTSSYDGGGSITINGGVINAVGGYGSAGIGSGFCDLDKGNNNITIRGGKINASSMNYTAFGIGDAASSSSAKIRINSDPSKVSITSTSIGHDVQYEDMEIPAAREIPGFTNGDQIPIWADADTEIKQTVIRDATLSDIKNSEGVSILNEPKTLTITQGDGKQTNIILYGNDTIEDVAKKINNAISKDLGQGKFTNDPKGFCTIADGTGTSSESVFSTEPVYTNKYLRDSDGYLILDDDGNPQFEYKTDADGNYFYDANGNKIPDTELVGYNKSATMLIRSAIPGKSGELHFSGDDELLNTLGLNTVQESTESVFKAKISDAHTNDDIAEVKITGNNLKGAINKNIDVEFSHMAGIKSIWDDTAKKYKLQAEEFSTIVHVSDQTNTFQIGANQGEELLLSIGDMSASGLSLDKISVVTRETATRSITIVDEAIDKVLSQRAKIGGYISSLETTAEKLKTMSENLSRAESVIRDADTAKEMMGFAKLQILEDSATSMISQANQITENILQLVR